jgi:hypothetical protein
VIQATLGQKQDSTSKITSVKRAGNVAYGIECPPNPSTTKKNKKGIKVINMQE